MLFGLLSSLFGGRRKGRNHGNNTEGNEGNKNQMRGMRRGGRSKHNNCFNNDCNCNNNRCNVNNKGNTIFNQTNSDTDVDNDSSNNDNSDSFIKSNNSTANNDQNKIQEKDTSVNNTNNQSKDFKPSPAPEGADKAMWNKASANPDMKAFDNAVSDLKKKVPQQLSKQFDMMCDFLKNYNPKDPNFKSDDTRMTQEYRNQIMNYMIANKDKIKYSIKPGETANVGGTYQGYGSNSITVTPSSLSQGTLHSAISLIHEMGHASGDMLARDHKMTGNEPRAMIAGESLGNYVRNNRKKYPFLSSKDVGLRESNVQKKSGIKDLAKNDVMHHTDAKGKKSVFKKSWDLTGCLQA